MTESSLPWAGTTDPDAGPYTDDNWSDWMSNYFTGSRATQGVVPGKLAGFSASGVASPITVNSGIAIVDGKYYQSDAAENIVIPTPAGATRVDVIVARKTWANQEVRLTRVVGLEGLGVPAITQNDGVTWDIPLWQASITVGGVITLTDRRHLAEASLAQRPIVNGRLTLTSGVAVTTADVTAATTIYFTPYLGDHITLWNGVYGGWVEYDFSELSLTVPNTSNQMYDIFLYNAGEGVLTLEAEAWTNDTTRNEAINLQDGVYLKTSDNRLYIGSFRTTAVAGQTEDSIAKRFVYNYFNRLPRALKRHDNTNSWTYGVQAWRQVNANAANQVEVVQGINENMVELLAVGLSLGVAAGGGSEHDSIGIALDATNVNNAAIYSGGANTGILLPMTSRYMDFVGVGYHYLAWVEYAMRAGVPSTFYGDNGLTMVRTGIAGYMMG